jgi:integrase
VLEVVHDALGAIDQPSPLVYTRFNRHIIQDVYLLESVKMIEQKNSKRAGIKRVPRPAVIDPNQRYSLAETHEISPPATFHDLRRSYGSLLLNSGASAEVIQELLGHADLRMTRRAYAHLLQKTLQRAVKKHLPTFGLEPSNVKPLTSSDKQGVE